MGGGPCAYNPEPLAPFFDMFYIGEGETVFNDLLDIYKEWKKSGKSRKEFLEMAAEVPGIYVPAFYDVEYHEDGTIKAFTPNNPHAKEKIEKQVVMDVTHTYYPRKPVVPFIKATQDRWSWRSREDVSGAAGSARQACFTVLQESGIWNF